MDYDDDGQVLNFVSGPKSDVGDRWDELADDVTKKVDEVVRGARQRFS